MSALKRVTLLNIAEIAGVNKSTVSLALRGDPRVKKATRERILKIAENLDYRPDTHLSHLMGYLRSKEQKQDEEVIAYLRFEEEGAEDMGCTPFFSQFRKGIKGELNKLGYKVEDFYLHKYEFNFRRLSQSLHHRGIKGIFVLPAEGSQQIDDFDWNKFAAVTMGYRLRSPILNRVVCDHVAAIRMVLEQISKLGYRRPLLALRNGRDAQVNCRWSIAFNGALGLFNEIEEGCVYQGDADSSFIDTIEKNRIDCVLGLSYNFAMFMEKSKLSLVDGCGFVLLDKCDGPSNVTGIDQRPFDQGQMVARQLSGFLDRNELGLPDLPFTLALRPVWCLGTTTRSA